MAKNPTKVAHSVLQALGGKEKIYRISHCATRLRVELNDDTLIKKEALDSIEGVSGYFYQSGQHQIILGTGFVNKVYAELEKDGVSDSIDDSNRPEKTNNSKIQQLTKLLLIYLYLLFPF